MRIAHYVAAVGLGVSLGVALAPSAKQQTAEKLTPATLRNMLEGLGYEIKVVDANEGKEQYSANFRSGSLNIPVAYSFSKSGNYIWLTVFLGENKPSMKYEDLLKENGNLQPTFFYISASGKLMAAEAIDNRNIVPAILKRCTDKLIADVEKTSKTWQSE